LRSLQGSQNLAAAFLFRAYWRESFYPALRLLIQDALALNDLQQPERSSLFAGVMIEVRTKVGSGVSGSVARKLLTYRPAFLSNSATPRFDHNLRSFDRAPCKPMETHEAMNYTTASMSVRSWRVQTPQRLKVSLHELAVTAPITTEIGTLTPGE